MENMMAVSKTPRKTMRDEFALAIVQGLVAGESRMRFDKAEKLAEQAYEMADAMIQARIQKLKESK